MGFFDLFKHTHIFGMVYFKIFARCGCKALFSGANAVLLLLFAGGIAEVCRRTANVVYVSLKVGHFCDQGGFSDNAFFAS